MNLNLLNFLRNRMLIAVAAGVATGMLGGEFLFSAATHLSEIYIKFLKLVGAPLVFLSICSTLSNISGVKELKALGGKVLSYTVLTTLLAASIGLAFFLFLDPKISVNAATSIVPESSGQGYADFLVGIFPSNFIQMFLDNNVIAIMMVAFLIGFAVLSLEAEKKDFLQNLFSTLFDVMIKVTEFILKFMPFAIWAFVTLFVKEQQSGLVLGALGTYFIAVIGANLVQGTIVLPILLKMKGYSPFAVLKGYMPALSIAFFTKSSNATLPMTMKCAQHNLKISQKVSNFTLPMCVTCNMNGCAAFIIITVLFVASSHGATFSSYELIGWVFLASLAAIGNAGVPMGCYFLTTAFLTAMDVPLNIMGLILPLYAIVDMVETALNVWSDGVIAAVVEKDLSSSGKLQDEEPEKLAA